jgi:hypothetical protein
MNPLADHASLSDRDALARLRYAGAVREEVRRAVLAPWIALVALGAVLVIHGSLATVWPHAALLPLVWIAAAIALRPVVRWLRRRVEQRRGIQGRARTRLACAGAAMLALALAIAFGASPLISALTAATAVAAYLCGMPSVAAAVIAVGGIGDVASAGAVAPSVSELIVGAGLVCAGAVAFARRRQSQ